MILYFIKGEFLQMIVEIQIVFACWIAVLIAVMLDLFFGIRKSKKEVNTDTHSYGLRKTFEKMAFYYSLMMLFLFADFFNPLGLYIDIFYFPIPLMTILITFSFLFTEGLSIKENVSKKYSNNLEKSTKQLLKIIINNKELLEEFKNKIK